MGFKVLIQTEEIEFGKEHGLLQNSGDSVGAIATFFGTVRDVNENRKVESISIEHYSGMTENELTKIINQARGRWKISAATIIHRVGSLRVGEGIVFVGTASSHRKDAFQSCDFIMDYLKTNAPLWKKETHDRGEDWVSSKESDQVFARSWKKGVPLIEDL